MARTALTGLVAGAAATAAKSKAEQVLQPLGERVFPPSAAAKTGLGADGAGHPENMPPSELVDRAQHAVTGDQLSDDQRQRVAPWLHWATGTGAGIAYAVAASRAPAVRTGRGALAGTGLFAATHGTVLPLAGLQHPLSTLPKAWWVWEAGSHVVYGMVLDAGLRLLERRTAR